MNFKNMIPAIPMKLFRATNETIQGIGMKLSLHQMTVIQIPSP